MKDLQRDGPDSGTPFEPTTAAERQAVRSERVVLSVSAPVFDRRHAGGHLEAAEGRDTDPDLADDDALAASQRIEPELPWSGLLGQPRNVVILMGGAVAAAIVWLLSGDAGNAFWSGLIAAFLVASQVIDWPSSFSFGQGFVGYRPDPPWPQGVQEDDDVHWNWRSRRATGGEARRQ